MAQVSAHVQDHMHLRVDGVCRALSRAGRALRNGVRATAAAHRSRARRAALAPRRLRVDGARRVDGVGGLPSGGAASTARLLRTPRRYRVPLLEPKPAAAGRPSSPRPPARHWCPWQTGSTRRCAPRCATAVSDALRDSAMAAMRCLSRVWPQRGRRTSARAATRCRGLKSSQKARPGPAHRITASASAIGSPRSALYSCKFRIWITNCKTGFARRRKL